MSKNSFEIQKSLRLKPVTEPADPQDGEIYYSSTENKFKKYENGAWTDLGSGGGVSSYITEGATGWVGYNDNPPATTRPVDGTGGSTLITLTDKTSTPISGTSSLLLTKPASNVQGQGVSKDFTIDIADKANILTIEFPYLVNSGTFAAGSTSTDGDLIVYLYDITNNRLIEPYNFKFFSNSFTVADKFIGSFQTSSDSVNYRLILHVASTSASAFSLEMGQIQISAQNIAKGLAGSDWISYTPVATVATGSLGSHTVTGSYKQIGDEVIIKATLTFTGSPGTWTGPEFSLPSGLSIDFSKGSYSDGGTSIYRNGVAVIVDIGTGTFSGVPVASANTGTNKFRIGMNSTDTVATAIDDPLKITSNVVLSNAYPMTFVSGDVISVQEFRVPIQGWSSNVAISDGYSDRGVILFTGTKSGAQSLTADVTNVTFTSTSDDTASWNGTDTYRVPTSGDYRISVSLIADGIAAFQPWVNGVARPSAAFVSASAVRGIGSIVLPDLRAGDTIVIRSSTTVNITSSTSNYLSIEKIGSSNQTFMVAEKVRAIVGRTTTQTIPVTTNTTLIFDSVLENSHGAYNPSTGVFTAPRAGLLKIDANVWDASNAANYTGYLGVSRTGPSGALTKNGFVYSNSADRWCGMISVYIPVRAGDTVSIFMWHTRVGGTTTAAGVSTTYASFVLE